MNKKLLILGGIGLTVAAAIMTKKIIGNEKDAYPDSYDHLFIKFADRFGLPRALVKAVAANESFVGKYQSLEPVGGTTGIMHIKLATARMFKKDLTAEELARPEVEIEYGVRYLKWLYDRYSRFDYSERQRFTVMAYNGGPGRVDELIKKGEDAVKNENWFKNISAYWNRYQGHVAKLTGNTNGKAIA